MSCAVSKNHKLSLKLVKKPAGKKGKISLILSSQTKKKPRVYHRYIQKKFSPAIITDVLANLSPAQIEWVKATGFGVILEFRTGTYTHKMRYNVVEAFDGETCTLKVETGDVKVSEELVQQILGFPRGRVEIKLDKENKAYERWVNQFPDKAGSLVTSLMVRKKMMLRAREADVIFKWNFLVMIYNFFIDAKQNRFLNRDVFHFSGNINKYCREYNWCWLMIEKLRQSHSYWKVDTKRIFSGPLPLLIVCGFTFLK